MKRSTPKLAQFASDQIRDSPHHFGGGFVREREQQNPFRRNPLLQQIRDAISQRARFARTRARDDKRRAGRRGDGGKLLRIEFARVINLQMNGRMIWLKDVFARHEKSLLQKPIVFRMMADPKPIQTFNPFFGDDTIMNSDSRSPKNTRLFQTQRRVSWILFEQLEIFFRQPLNFLRQTVEVFPKFRRCEMRHSGRHLPCSNARSAAAPNSSNLPDWASAANRFSHFSAK